MLYTMRGRLLLRRGPLTGEWRSSAWLICGRGWASKCALLQSSWHLAWLVAHWLALLFVFIYAHIHRLVLTCNISTVHLCVFQRHRPCFAPDDAGVAARRLIGLGARNHKGTQAISATLHLAVGLMIIVLSVGMLLP